MNLIQQLQEAQRNATGAAGELFGTILSLPHATIAGMVNSFQGKSFNEASTEVMNTYARAGKKVGRERSDEIVRQLIEAHRKSSGHK
jgi:hypothetical protein